MVFKFFKNIKYCQRGITLVELVIVIFITTLFTLIAISDFPKIIRGYALSRVTYKLAQDLRGVQDLSLSGVTTTDAGGCLVPAKGYGIYVNTSYPNQYAIYADIDGDKKYTVSDGFTLCEQKQYYSAETGNGVNSGRNGLIEDCVMQIVPLAVNNVNLSIQRLASGNSYASINFIPPNPTTTITSGLSNPSSEGIFLINVDSTTPREVMVNTSGLINVQ